MAKRNKRLVDEVKKLRPDIDASETIAAGRVLVDGRLLLNPSAMVSSRASVSIKDPTTLRGKAKLGKALETLHPSVEDRIALDVGAAAGGFTQTLVEAGARKVYAVDAGFGQLIGSLRQEPKVITLEATNLGELTTELVPDTLEVLTVDLSYLSLADALPQFHPLNIAPGAELIALVKPMFELGLAAPPTDRGLLREALGRAQEAAANNGWEVIADMESPVRGSKGAVEFFFRARRKRETAARRKSLSG